MTELTLLEAGTASAEAPWPRDARSIVSSKEDISLRELDDREGESEEVPPLLNDARSIELAKDALSLLEMESARASL